MLGAVTKTRHWLVVGVLTVWVASCHREPRPREPAPAPTASLSVPQPQPVVEPIDASASDAASLETVDAPDAAPAKPKFGPAPSTTPGHILCGDQQCDLATEVCCEHEPAGIAQCMPKPPPDQEACGKVRGAAYEKHCDEKADCPGDQSCCLTWGCSGGCPPVAVCSKVPCLHGPVELCLPGGACSKGFHCVPGDGNRPGSCEFDRAGVTCGDTRCSGTTPICCWDTKARTGECVAQCNDQDELNLDLWALRCTSPDDCGGYPCADFGSLPMRIGACFGAYDVPDRSQTVFCRTIRDCPTMNLQGKPKACRAAPAFPRGVKVCVYPTS